jgi:FlaA1/EpsC-like NDP-sugar epimerase
MMVLRQKFFLDVCAWSIAAIVAFFVRIDLPLLEYSQAILWFALVGIIPKTLLIWHFGSYRQSWHKVGVRDLYRLVVIIAGWTGFVYISNFVLFPWTGVPRSVPLIEGATALLFMGGMRLLARVFFEREGMLTTAGNSRRVLVIGAGAGVTTTPGVGINSSRFLGR